MIGHAPRAFEIAGQANAMLEAPSVATCFYDSHSPRRRLETLREAAKRAEGAIQVQDAKTLAADLEEVMGLVDAVHRLASDCESLFKAALRQGVNRG